MFARIKPDAPINFNSKMFVSKWNPDETSKKCACFIIKEAFIVAKTKHSTIPLMAATIR